MISQVSECGCSDIDCKAGSDCLGNRLEIVTIGGQERIKLIAPHHKTEGSASQETNAPITFIFPLCILNTLLVWWIKTGWYLVREGKQRSSSMVFASGHLKTLSCYTMVGWWEGYKKNHCPPTLKPGTITELRSIFIEAYTARVPDDDIKWHKAALVMGNSVFLATSLVAGDVKHPDFWASLSLVRGSFDSWCNFLSALFSIAAW